MNSLNNAPRLGWQGNLELEYRFQNKTTRLTRAQIKAPLKIQRPFYPEAKTICHSVTLHTAGGVVGGDRLCQSIHLHPQAKALITTATAGKVYRSNGQLAQQTIALKIESGAVLEWLPQETIIFNGAIFQQDLRVELSPGASWLGWEITRFGRSARGEKFLQGEWRSHTEIWQQGKPLWIDRQWLPANEETFYHPHGLAGNPVAATLVWIGQPVSEEIVNKARTLWQAEKYQGEAGVTQTQAQGLLCRYRGSSTAQVKHWFMEVWQLLRHSFYQSPICKPRVW